jgi:flavin-dependent dehydrogenase
MTGAAAALRLRQVLPEARILVVEQSTTFPVRPEATSELHGLYLTRALRLWNHLARHQLPHHGTRLWFHDEDVLRIQNATEFGTRAQPRFPSFLLREDVICEHLLSQAEQAGVELLRPAVVLELELEAFDSRVHLEVAGDKRCVRATWVLDASGRDALIGRKLGLLEPERSHPLAALTARWTGDLDLDGPHFAPDTDFGRATLVARRLCSNSFLGYGYSVNCLALGDGQMEVTLVWDKRVLDLHQEPDLLDAYTAFLSGLPATRQLLQQADLDTTGLRILPQVGFRSRRVSGQGWALLGTAAGFLDHGLGSASDQSATTIECTIDLVSRHLEGQAIGKAIERYNRGFQRGFDRQLAARFRDRSLIAGDFDLYWPLFLIDKALFVLADLLPALRTASGARRRPQWSGPLNGLRATALRLIGRRFLQLAKNRMWTGNYGRHNHGLRLHYHVDSAGSAFVALGHGLTGWALREFEDLGMVVQRLWAYFVRGQRRMPEGNDLDTLPDGIDVVGSSVSPVD